MTQYIVRKRERINSIIIRLEILIFPLKLTEKYNLSLNENKNKIKKNLLKTHKLTSLSALFQK